MDLRSLAPKKTRPLVLQQEEKKTQCSAQWSKWRKTMNEQTLKHQPTSKHRYAAKRTDKAEKQNEHTAEIVLTNHQRIQKKDRGHGQLHALNKIPTRA